MLKSVALLAGVLGAEAFLAPAPMGLRAEGLRAEGLSAQRPGAECSGLSALRMEGAEGQVAEGRRSFLLGSAALAGLAVVAPESASAQIALPGARGDRPGGLGPQAGGRYLSLCDSENCVSTSEDVYSKRYLPPWTYNDGGKKTKSIAEAKKELMDVLKSTKGVSVVQDKDSYIYTEFERELGFVDDVEFLFSPNGQTVEYRSAARKSKKSDHRSRIRNLRLALQEKGWRSVGYR